MKQFKKRRTNAGLTLVELMVVMAIVGILAVVTVPSATRMYERGQQNNRMNIARTIYLATQNQLTKMFTERTLEENLTWVYLGTGCCDTQVEPGVTDSPLIHEGLGLNDFNIVADELGPLLDLPDNENLCFIRYISKPIGFLNDPVNPTHWIDRDGNDIPINQGEVEFFNLLSEVIIDQDILYHPILMEFNIMTGTILSIFYGDAGQVEFLYSAAPPGVLDIQNIIGGRGLGGGYQFANERRQGYFGVESTGEPDIRRIEQNLREFAIVNIYDGAETPLVTQRAAPVGAEVIGAPIATVENILYAEFILFAAPDELDVIYNFILRGTFDSFLLDFPTPMTLVEMGSVNNLATTIEQNALPEPFRPPIYLDVTNPVQDHEVQAFGLPGNLYNRYILVINYIGDDLGGITRVVDERGDDIRGNPQTLRIEIESDAGSSITSFTRAHSHFGGIQGGRFTISTARHLNNIRHVPGNATNPARYRQTENIDMLRPNNRVSRFVPIPLLIGEYIAMPNVNPPATAGFRIDNLNIINPPNLLNRNVGLFRELNNATIQGLSLFNVNIIARDAENIGAIAGRMDNSTIMQSYVYGNVTGWICICVDGTGAPIPHNPSNIACGRCGCADGPANHVPTAPFCFRPVRQNVGGLVGLNVGGTLVESFNAGFANTLEVAPCRTRSVCICAIPNPTCTNIGSVRASGGNVGGLVGTNAGAIRNSFSNVRVNIENVSVDAASLSHNPIATKIDCTTYVGGITGVNAWLQPTLNPLNFNFFPGTIANTYATNYQPNYENWRWSMTGGIVGANRAAFRDPSNGDVTGFTAGSGTLTNNFYVSNGLFDFAGARAISKEELQTRFQGNNFFINGNTNPPPFTNSYHNNFYPYPILARNNPLNLNTWFWEDIFEIPLGPINFLYYELYDNGLFGYSEGGMNPLINNNRERIVVNEGYVLEFDDRRALNIIFSPQARNEDEEEDDRNTFTYTLTPIPGGGWVWASPDTGLLPAHNPVWYDTNLFQDLPIHRVFFDNNFFESIIQLWTTAGWIADGSAFIFIEVRDALNEILHETNFNPLFADTVGRAEGAGLTVRSPRHIRNINRALGENYQQTINIDFNLYRSELGTMPVQSNPANDGITPRVNSAITFDGNRAVVQGNFMGRYLGGSFAQAVNADGTNLTNMDGTPIFEWVNYEIRRIGARNNQGDITSGPFALFNILGPTAIVERINIIDSNFRNIGANTVNAVGSIAAVNHGLISFSSVQNTKVHGTGTDIRVGGIVGANEIIEDDFGFLTLSGIIEDSFFLSTEDNVPIPSSGTTTVNRAVSNNGGGIAGFNAGCIFTHNPSNHAPMHDGDCVGGIRRVFYLAPAPMAHEIGTTPAVYRKYPFVRDGVPVGADCLFLRGRRYKRSLTADWTNNPYNVTNVTGNVRLSGGGFPMSTEFFDLIWIDFLNRLGLLQGWDMMNMENWMQPTQQIYPYPLVRGMAAPLDWPITESRPTQKEVDDWEAHIPTGDRLPAPGFVNGFFEEINPPGVPGGRMGDNVNVSTYIHMGYWWFTTDMRIINGWYTRPVEEFRHLFEPSHRDYFFPARHDGDRSHYGEFRMIRPATISATSNATTAANLFSYNYDNSNTASVWTANTGTNGGSYEITWNYSQPMTLHYYQMQVSETNTTAARARDPRTWRLEGRNDTTSTWTVIHNQSTDVGAWGAGQTRTFRISGPRLPAPGSGLPNTVSNADNLTPTAFRFYRLVILTTAGTGTTPTNAFGTAGNRPELRQLRMHLSDIVRWRLIELQVANGDHNAVMRTDYRGRNLARTAIANNNPNTSNAQNSLIRYAELNAESQGTLYQVLPTTPGATFYYSFYHATNGYPNLFLSGSTSGGDYDGWYTGPDSGGDRLHFYLSQVGVGRPLEVDNTAYAAERDAAMVLIRPCQSPRSAQVAYADHSATTPLTTFNYERVNMGTADLIVLNPAAWNTVAYGRSDQERGTATTGPDGLRSGGPYDLSYHQGRAYLQPNGSRVVQNIPTTPIFLYDVWVDTRTGIATVAGSTFGDFTQSGNPNNAVTGNIINNPHVNRRNGGTREGYGITFWSTRNLTATNANSSNTNINLNGITEERLVTDFWTWLVDARNNVIGYWDIEYGWKRYYGEYTVPEEQEQTEFAFQSRSGPRRVVSGNYLDGVSFMSPAFLSIDKYFRENISGNPGTDNVTFVRPGAPLFIELFVKNHGEVQADRIVVRDRLTPYNDYIDFDHATLDTRQRTTTEGPLPRGRIDIGSIVTVHRRSVVGRDSEGLPIMGPWTAVTGFTATYGPSESNAAEMDIQVAMPTTGAQAVALAHEDELRVRVRIRVRDVLPATSEDAGVSTLLYHFKNQGAVDYNENLLRFGATRFSNASGPQPVQVFIDPVRLSKSVSPLVGGPFDVTLRLEDIGGGVIANGQITEILPQGFELVRSVELRRRLNHTAVCPPANCPPGSSPCNMVATHRATCTRVCPPTCWVVVPDDNIQIANNADGTTRMLVSGVQLDTVDTNTSAQIRSLDYRYRVRYTGIDYGIAELQSFSDYKYLYQRAAGDERESIASMFPNIIVGLRPGTTNDDFIVTAPDNGFDILANDVFGTLLEQDGYAIEESVIFVHENGIPFTTGTGGTPGYTIDGGNARYETDHYIASIVRAANIRGWRLLFTPKAGSAGLRTLHYQIMLTARKAGSPDIVIYSDTARVRIEVPQVTVTGINLRDLIENQTVTNARIEYRLINGTFTPTITPANFAISGLPPGLVAGTAVRTSATVVTVPITRGPGTPPPPLPVSNAVVLTLPASIPGANLVGIPAGISLAGVTVTVGPILPVVTVTAVNLGELKVNVPVTNASIVYTFNNRTLVTAITPADFAVSGLPPGLVAGTAVRTSDTVVTIPITGTPTMPPIPYPIPLNLPVNIPSANFVGSPGVLPLGGITVTVGPVLP